MGRGLWRLLVQPLALKVVWSGGSGPPLPSLASSSTSVHPLSQGRALGELSWSLQVWVNPVLPPWYRCLRAEQGKGEVPLNAAQTEQPGRSSTGSQEPISWPTATIPGRTLLTDACDSFGKASVGRCSASSRCLSKTVKSSNLLYFRLRNSGFFSFFPSVVMFLSFLNCLIPSVRSYHLAPAIISSHCDWRSFPLPVLTLPLP